MPDGKKDSEDFEARAKELVDAGYEAVEKAIIACTRCPLHETATNRVIGKGSRTPKVLFIGEAPGKNEDEKGIPFCGRAGKELDKMVEYMGLSEKDWAVINTVKCRPPENRNPKKTELESCKPFLLAQITLLDPNLIILLGNTAEKAYCPEKKLEWGVPENVEGQTVLKLFHPAALIYTRSRTGTQHELIDRNRGLWE
ncbi:uracil-DNA glycosylase [Methanosarcina sp. KYL-1]|uniref:uracil-DNA glycosylase n=1 Tax=Methanosarcina sp. KYL-1 TaxID=2602068 RepID=UPI0021016640|nr:uracil-DNA glycosylase [Methanosarcina sp. KYL-1]MCQ1536908.1 uracil-DNA glycosylase [Methanosarcina sp. KYL-1]